VSAYVPFSWYVLGLLIAGALGLGLILRLREDLLEVPISAMLIFSVDSHAAATSRITETLVGAAAGLAAGLLFAPLRVQPAKEAVGDLSRQMADLLGQMADGLAAGADPKRAIEWLERTRALRGEIERVDDALSQAEESVRLNPRRLRFANPAAGLREGVDTLERAATDMRVLARSVADSARIDSEHSPVREAETRGRLAAVLAELSAAVRAYGQLLEAEPVPSEQAGHSGHGGLSGFAGRAGREGRAGQASFATEPLTEVLEDHLEEAGRQQDRLADLLQADPAEQPEGWPLRGEILAHVDRLRSELQPGRLPGQIDDRGQVRQPLRALRDRRRDARTPRGRDARDSRGARGGRGELRGRGELGGRARRTAARVRGMQVRGMQVRGMQVRGMQVRGGRRARRG
jgi:gas vesicle protein